MANVIEMNDGREVDFGARGKVKREVTVEDGNVTIQFDIINGDTHTFSAEVAEHPLAVQIFAHGASAKIGDAAANQSGDDASAAIEQMIARLDAGKWTDRKPGAAKGLNDFVEAVAIVTGKETDEDKQKLRTDLMAYDDDQLDDLKAHPKVLAEMATIRAQRAAEKAEKAAQKAAKDAEGEEVAGESILGEL